ncbi:MAG: hypothetical protein JJU09_06525 [Rhodobacteraceae bacterium]|nr:hypothetical protein [Paracoccaceae bacterium]
MEKKTIIRGAAIACAGIAVSALAAQYLLTSLPGEQAQVKKPTAQQDSDPVLSAGLVRSGSSPYIPVESDIAPEAAETTLAALDTGVGLHLSIREDLDLLPDLSEQAAQDSAPDCTPDLQVKPGIDALIDMRLSAPCDGGAPITITHGELEFNGTLSEDGAFSAFVPALMRDAELRVSIGGDQIVQAATEVPDADEHLRVVLQWTGDAPLALHAYHRGAGFGDDGHLHASRPFDTSIDAAFLISLGDMLGPDAKRAEVYSIPLTHASDARVEVELNLSDALCDGTVDATVLQSHPADAAVQDALAFDLPGCPAGSGALVMALPLSAQSLPGMAGLPAGDSRTN